jgi:hypothetical protein
MADAPRFAFGIIKTQPGRELEAHLHAEGRCVFYVLTERDDVARPGAGRTLARAGAFVRVP